MSGPHIGSNGSLSGHARPRGSVRGPMPDIPPQYRGAVRERLSEVLDIWCSNVNEGVRNNERTAMNAWPRAMGVIGAEADVNIALAVMQAFGMAIEEVRQIIEAHRDSSAIGLDEAQQYVIDLGRWVIGQDPERSAAILTALGGQNASLALEAPRSEPDTNGHG